MKYFSFLFLLTIGVRVSAETHSNLKFCKATIAPYLNGRVDWEHRMNIEPQDFVVTGLRTQEAKITLTETSEVRISASHLSGPNSSDKWVGIDLEIIPHSQAPRPSAMGENSTWMDVHELLIQDKKYDISTWCWLK